MLYVEIPAWLHPFRKLQKERNKLEISWEMREQVGPLSAGKWWVANVFQWSST